MDTEEGGEGVGGVQGGEGVGGVPKKNRPESIAATGVGSLPNDMLEVPPLRSRRDGPSSMVEGVRDE